MQKLQGISLYSGGGGLDKGADDSGNVETILSIDYAKAECETIKINFPDAEVICGKVGDYIHSLPKVDVVMGGPPCPEFSRAKTTRTFDMCEVDNFWEAVGIVKPKYYLMENVQDIKKKLIKHNFKINCADYGVPQTRERRIFTNLPLPPATHAENPQMTLDGTMLKSWINVKDALNLDGIIEDRKTTFGEFYKKEDARFREYSTENPSMTILADARPWFVSKTGFKDCNMKEKTRSVDKPAPTIMASEQMQFTNYKIYSTKFLKEKNPAIYQKHPPNDQEAPFATILAKDRGNPNEMVTDGNYARKLTLEELAILQGFPKDYVFCGNKGEQRRQIGNAVPPPVAKAFFNQIEF